MTSEQQMIEVNGQAVDMKDVKTVADLMAQQAITQRRVLVVVNDEIMPKSSWSEAQIRVGDRIDIMSPISGG